MSEEQVGIAIDPLSCDFRAAKETSKWRGAGKVARIQR